VPVLTGQVGEPLEQLVAQEAELPPARKPVTRDAPFSDHLAQVLDVHLEELGGEGGGEDQRELLGRGRLREHRQSLDLSD
jgi:hypothetical protein